MEEMLRIIPIWVKFPRLRLHLWGVNSLSKIASTMGVPLNMDECTAIKLRISYARVFVELDVTRERRKTIRVSEPDGSILVHAVENEWLPKFCAKCLSFGRDCAKEAAPTETRQTVQEVKKIWRPKIYETCKEACERAFKASKALLKAKSTKSSVVKKTVAESFEEVAEKVAEATRKVPISESFDKTMERVLKAPAGGGGKTPCEQVSGAFRKVHDLLKASTSNFGEIDPDKEWPPLVAAGKGGNDKAKGHKGRRNKKNGQ